MNKKRVLFLCTGNSARSQMAEGLLRKFARGEFEVFSAGTNPAPNVHPLAIAAMTEERIDISQQKPKPATQFLKDTFDYIITVCDNAKQTCPIFPGKARKIHWNLQDPAAAQGTEEEQLDTFRKTRDEIKLKILEFVQVSTRE